MILSWNLFITAYSMAGVLSLLIIYVHLLDTNKPEERKFFNPLYAILFIMGWPVVLFIMSLSLLGKDR